MKRKSILVVLLLLAVGVGGYFVGRSTNHKQAVTAAKEKTLYTCGMHPQVVQDHPGNCPICGMKLEPMRKQGTGIKIDPVTIQDMGIRTGVITNGPLRRVIRTVGTIDYNEPTLADVTTKFKGWIEKLYVDATGQLVMRGDPLFEIYSPELYTAQTEYLLALKGAQAASSQNDPDRDTLLQSARLKLKFFDISDEQIAALERTGRPKKSLRIVAPQDGFVVEKNVVEGQMVQAGMQIYRLADLGLVWVYAEVYEQDLPYIRLGQEALVTLSYLPDRQFRGRVTYIYPNVDQKTRTVRVRMEFHNPGFFLKPGMFANVEVRAELAPSALLVPDSAILRSGQKNTVFVALEGGRFAPRSVVLGPRAEHDMYQVLAGLHPGDRVVTSGQFMLDSESQLREAIQKMTEPGQSAAASPITSTDTNTVSSNLVSESGETVYVCPMPEHISIEYDHPGKCPICGMTLVPVLKSTLEKMHPGGKVLYYTCPMPEHSDVHEDHPGKCPKCGMTLIPVMSTPPLTAEASARRDTSGLQIPKDHGKTGTKMPMTANAPIYTCPMHPSVKQSQPGNCPICEMKLVPVKPATGDHPSTAAKSNAALPTLYTCPTPSHADVVSDKPGKCPKCGMDLVKTSTLKHGNIAEEKWRKEYSTKDSPPGGESAEPQPHE